MYRINIQYNIFVFFIVTIANPANTKHLCYVYKIFNPISVKYY